MTSRFALLITLCLWLTACRSAADYVTKGDVFSKEGNHDEAIINYRKAIQKEETFGEAHYKLALSARKKGDTQQASQELARAAQLLPNRDDVQAVYSEAVLETYLSNRSRPKALYEQLHLISDQMLKNNPASLSGLRVKATLAITDKKPKDAIVFLRKANDAKPHDSLTVELYMQALFQDGAAAEAERLGWEAIQHNKSAIPIYSILYKHYLIDKQRQNAERVLREKLVNNPDLPDSYIDLAAFYHSDGNLAARAQILGQLLSGKSLSAQAHLVAAEFYKAVGEYDNAKKLYRDGAQAHPQNKLPYVKGEVNALLLQGQKEDSLKASELALKDFPDDSDLKMNRGFILSESSDPAKAEVGIAELRAVTKQKPNSASLHYALGQALARRGSRAEAGAEYKLALKANPRFELALYGLSELSLLDKQHGEAKRYADQVLQLNPDQNKAKLIRAMAERELGNYDNATADLQQLARDNPSAPEPLLEMGRLRFAQNNFTEAEKLFLSSYKAGQADIRNIEGLVNTYIAQNKLNSALQLLNNELTIQPQNTALRSLHSSVALLAGDFGAAADSARKLLASREGVVEGHLRLGDALLRSAKPKDARIEFQAAQKADPDNKQAAAMIPLALEAEGLIPEAIAAYRRAIELQPENPALMNNLAFLLAERGEKLEDALRLAQGATQRSRRPEFMDTLGWIYLKKDSADSAIQAFRGAIKQQPNNPEFHFHLGLAFLKKGDSGEASREFKAALALKPDTSTQSAIRDAMSKSAL